MKMRRILPLVILAVTAFFVLSGCDAMLDAIFQNNQISMDVRLPVSPNHIGDYWYNQTYVTIYEGGSQVQQGNTTSGYYDGTYAHYYFTFSKLKNSSTYQIYAQFVGTIGANNNYFYYDPNTGVPTNAYLSLPDPNPGDSTGHSVNLLINMTP
jgi:hypothetical protein